MIHIFMPVMRPPKALKVMEDLANQTRAIDCLTIVDNCGAFDLRATPPFLFELEFDRPKENIGTNAVWNKMFTSSADFVGFIGDDYRVEKYAIQGLVEVLERNDHIQAVTATIFKEREVSFRNRTIGQWSYGKVVARGHCGLTIFKTEALKKIKPIPDGLFIFFGDNWLGNELIKIGNPLQEVNVGITHRTSNDLKSLLDYKSILKKEHSIWRKIHGKCSE